MPHVGRALLLLGILLPQAASSSNPAASLTGVWILTFSDALFPGRVYLTLDVQGKTVVAGTYRTAQGDFGRIWGHTAGRKLRITLSQPVDPCPATYTATLALDGDRATGTFVGFSCKSEEQWGSAAMVRAASPDVEMLTQLGAAAQREDRARRAELCPRCPSVLLYYVDAVTGGYRVWQLSASQRAWLERELRFHWRKRGRPHLWPTHYQDNADYLVFWTESRGARADVEYSRVAGAETPGETTRALGFGEGWGVLHGSLELKGAGSRWLTDSSAPLYFSVAVYDSRTGSRLRVFTTRSGQPWASPDREALAQAFGLLLGNTAGAK